MQRYVIVERISSEEVWTLPLIQPSQCISAADDWPEGIDERHGHTFGLWLKGRNSARFCHAVVEVLTGEKI